MVHPFLWWRRCSFFHDSFKGTVRWFVDPCLLWFTARKLMITEDQNVFQMRNGLLNAPSLKTKTKNILGNYVGYWSSSYVQHVNKTWIRFQILRQVRHTAWNIKLCRIWSWSNYNFRKIVVFRQVYMFCWFGNVRIRIRLLENSRIWQEVPDLTGSKTATHPANAAYYRSLSKINDRLQW